jgi:hypothetical protein
MWAKPTKKDLAGIPALYSTEDVKTGDKIVHAHFFVASCDWWAVEFDHEDGDTFFGFACLGDPDMAEWGYFSLSELEEIKIRGIFEVDFDKHWHKRLVREVPGIAACPLGILE